MFPRRERLDPETARQIEQRLNDLLAEPYAPDDRSAVDELTRGADPPRRAAAPVPAAEWPEADEVRTPPGPAAPWVGALRSLALSRMHLGVVAVLAVLCLLVAGWVVLRARPVAIATPLSPPTSAAAPASTPGAGSTPATSSSVGPSPTAAPSTAELVVHVLGAVRRPGLVRLPAGSRVEDALDQAGGLRASADPGRLNLAAVLADGQQIFVGTKGKPGGEVRYGTGGTGGSEGGTSGSAGSSSGGQADLNAATQAQLEELPGVGPVTATKIIAWRQEHGRFSRVEELQEVSGIGPKTYAEIAPHCRV